ncbi:MAG: TIR domain-containing protein [Anaerolineae bacterium]|nr:TIR domain-containing protein [Anaerolineae bacterium]
MSHVFVSYSRKDQEYARRVEATLRARGFNVWIDERIDYGDRWFRTIVEAVEACAAFVVIMSPDAEKSEWVEREVLLAQREQKPIFPLLLSGRGFALLITTQFADVTPGAGEEPPLPPDDFYERLAEVAPRAEVAGQSVAPPPPNFATIPLPPDKQRLNVAINRQRSGPPPEPVRAPDAAEAEAAPQMGRRRTRGFMTIVLVLVLLALLAAVLLVLNANLPAAEQEAPGTATTAALAATDTESHQTGTPPHTMLPDRTQTAAVMLTESVLAATELMSPTRLVYPGNPTFSFGVNDSTPPEEVFHRVSAGAVTGYYLETQDLRSRGWVRWRPGDFYRSGSYEISVWIPEQHSSTQNAHYHVYADGRDTTVSLDQSQYANEWAVLGIFDIDAYDPTDGVVSLNDLTGETDREIAISTARWRLVADGS